MKILVLTQHIFPIQTPRSLRSTELIKELARRGHEVTVYAVLGTYDYSSFEQEYHITVKNIPIHWERHPYNSDGDCQRTLQDKILGRLFHKLEFPLMEFYFRIPEIIKNEDKADLILSIAAPHHIHWGCARAKKLYPTHFAKTWIADCGDPFMKNGTTKEHLHFFSKYEKQFCTECTYITVPIQEAIPAYYEEFHSKIRVIPQGFNFDLHLPTNKEVQNDIPTFAYAGMFYSDIRNPKLFLDYISSLSIDYRFYVYTKYSELIEPYKEAFGERLILCKPIERVQLIEKLRGMDFLINIQNSNNPNQLPSKLIDYGIANRPILDVNPSKIDTKTIDEFLQGEYRNKLEITNLADYHIGNVADKFEALFIS